MKSVRYIREPSGLAAEIVYPDSAGTTMNYTYTAHGQIDTIKRGVSEELVAYDYYGTMVRQRAYGTFASPVVTLAAAYDTYGRLTQYDTVNSSAVGVQFDYRYDANGNILTKTLDHRSGDPAKIYAYDTLDRVVRADYTVPDPDEDEQFTYDILGNRLTLNNRAGSEIVYTSNVVNEYTAIGGVVPLYDACGNLTKDIHGYTYHYDNDNRVTQIKKNGDADEVAAYTYDALGRRIRKYDAVAAAAVRCYYDDQRVLLETDDSNNDQRAFVYGNYVDEVLVMTDYTAQDDPDYYYGHDHLYSVAVIFEANGAVYERAEYNAYGEATRLDPDFTPWSGTEIGNSYYFTGRRLDTLNGNTFHIYYYRARYYDAETGRFLQKDPLGLLVGLNLYEYVRSMPAKGMDPLGLFLLFCKAECTPPAPGFPNAYDPEIVGWGKTTGPIGTPDTVPVGIEGVKAFNEITNIAAIIMALGACRRTDARNL